MLSRAPPWPCTTASRPSPSIANGRGAELPERPGELLVGREQRLRRLAGQAELVDVPPAGPVGGHVEARVVLPERGQHRLPDAALEQPALARHPVLDRRDPQLGAVPGHVRVIPARSRPASCRRATGSGTRRSPAPVTSVRIAAGSAAAEPSSGTATIERVTCAAVVALLHAPDLARRPRRARSRRSAARAGASVPVPDAAGTVDRVRGERPRLPLALAPSPGRPGTAAGRRSWRRDAPGPAGRPGLRCPARAGPGPAGRTARRTRAPGSARSRARAAAPSACPRRPGT